MVDCLNETPAATPGQRGVDGIGETSEPGVALRDAIRERGFAFFSSPFIGSTDGMDS